MVRIPAFLLATVVASMMIAGCTFLISFDDVPTPGDGGPGADGPTIGNAPDVRVDAPAAPDASDGTKDAARDAIANPDACVNFPDGLYCGGNQISWPVADKDDLVTCKGHVVSSGPRASCWERATPMARSFGASMKTRDRSRALPAMTQERAGGSRSARAGPPTAREMRWAAATTSGVAL